MSHLLERSLSFADLAGAKALARSEAHRLALCLRVLEKTGPVEIKSGDLTARPDDAFTVTPFEGVVVVRLGE